jgi:hypothetical protein
LHGGIEEMNILSKYYRLVVLLFLLVSWIFQPAIAADHKITFRNYCSQTIWVGQDGTVKDGWEMLSNTTVVKNIPVGFSGRWWPRTGCTFGEDGKCPTEGVDCCDSGGCLTSDPKYFGLVCNSGGNPPVSLFEPTFDAGSGHGPIDYMDLSAVDGFSVPMQMAPDPGFNTTPDPGMDPRFWCQVKGWVANPTCPPDLWDNDKKVCWGPCKYFTVVKAVTTGDNKANICCDNTNVDDPPTPGKTCDADDFIGGFGCTPYHTPPYTESQTCHAKDPGKHGYWGDISDPAWSGIATNSLQYISDVNAGIPGVYAWQFDDLNSTYFCRKDGGVVDYTITFCPISLYATWASGLYQASGNTWSKIHAAVPTNMVASGSNLYATWPSGLFQWNGSAWTKIHAAVPTSMTASGPVLYAVWPSGLFQWNGSAWSKIHSAVPTGMTAANNILYATWPSGLFQWNGSEWSKIHPAVPTKMIASSAVLYATWSSGLYSWNGSEWTKIHPAVPTGMVTSGSNLYATWSSGLFQWNGSEWTKIHSAVPTGMTAGGNALYATWSSGLFQWNGSEWTKIHSVAPVSMKAGN